MCEFMFTYCEKVCLFHCRWYCCQWVFLRYSVKIVLSLEGIQCRILRPLVSKILWIPVPVNVLYFHESCEHSHPGHWTYFPFLPNFSGQTSSPQAKISPQGWEWFWSDIFSSCIPSSIHESRRAAGSRWTRGQVISWIHALTIYKLTIYCVQWHENCKQCSCKTLVERSVNRPHDSWNWKYQF